MSTHTIPLSIQKQENRPKLSQICIIMSAAMGFFPKDSIAVVNQTSVFEPLKFYSNSVLHGKYFSVVLTGSYR